VWPDWSGQTAVIVGTGPSAVPIEQGPFRAVVIKSSWRLAPWADVLYGIDKGWWIANHGAPHFKGLKVSPSPTVCKVFGLRQVTLKPRAEILLGTTGVIGCGLKTGGGFSGFQAINLAVQFGAKRIVLVGFDMSLSNGAHWNSDQRGVAKPDADRVKSWRIALDRCAPQFKSLGVEVINTAEHSALTAFPKMALEQALKGDHGSQGQDHAVQSEVQLRRAEGVF
jgi:hypothetical protein